MQSRERDVLADHRQRPLEGGPARRQAIHPATADPALGHRRQEIHIPPAVLGGRIRERLAPLHDTPEQEALGLALVLTGRGGRPRARGDPRPDGGAIVLRIGADGSRLAAVRALPPGLSSFSRTVTSHPAFAMYDAADNPAKPLPIIITFFNGLNYSIDF